MRNKQTNSLIVAFILTGFAISCSMFGGANSNGNATSNSNSKTNSNLSSSTPAIETSPETFGKEWLADRAAADDKYKGKTISMTGEVWVAQQIGEQIFITFEAVPFDLKAGGVKIECVSDPTREAKMIVDGFKLNQVAANYSTNKNAKPPQMKAVIKGTYERSAPPDRPDGFITLNPCEVSLY